MTNDVQGDWKMQRYANAGGNSGILAYETDFDSITVRFKSGAEYLYTTRSAGAATIETMKDLAECGQGLNTFITRYARMSYESRLN